LVQIRINVKKKENFSIIEKEATTNVSMIENIFSKRKLQTSQTDIDEQNNMRVIIVIRRVSGKSDPIWMIWSSYDYFTFLT